MTTTTSTSTNKSARGQRKSASSQGGDLLDAAGPTADDKYQRLTESMSSLECDLDIGTSNKLMGNEMRSHKNRGFHDGYDEGKRSSLQGAYDNGYKKAFEQNFILSTLKGVANALRSSHRNQEQQMSGQSQSRPTSAISTSPCSSSSPASTSSTASPLSKQSKTISKTNSNQRGGTGSDSACPDDDHKRSNHHHHHSSPPSSSSAAFSSRTSSSGRRQSSPYAQSSRLRQSASSMAGDDVASTCSSSSISSNRSSTAGCYSSTNVSISSNHLSLLDSMKFDATSDIESIKKDLIKICRENRLEILAHYVSQIG